jgi:hypothetical protein
LKSIWVSENYASQTFLTFPQPTIKETFGNIHHHIHHASIIYACITLHQL